MQEQFYEALENEGDLEALYTSVSDQINHLQQSKSDQEQFLRTQIQQNQSIDVNQSMREYMKLNNQTVDTYDIELLEEIIGNYDELKNQLLVCRVEKCLDFVNSVEAILQQTMKMQRNKSKYINPGYLDSQRQSDFNITKQLYQEIINNPLSDGDTKLMQSIQVYYTNLLNTLAYHSSMQMKQNFITQHNSTFNVDLSVYQWIQMNSQILEKEDLVNSMIAQLITYLGQRIEQLALQEHSIEGQCTEEQFIDEITDIDSHTIIVIKMNQTLGHQSFYKDFIALLGILLELGDRLNYNLIPKIEAKLSTKFKQLLVVLLQDINTRDQIVSGILEQHISDERVGQFLNALEIPILLQKHSQLSLVDQINASLVELKDALVAQNSILCSHIGLFVRPPQEPQSKSGKLRSFLISKTVGEAKKLEQPFQLGPEAQKLQSQYFMILSAQLKRFERLVESSLEQGEPWQLLRRLWSHFELLRFLLTDLDRTIQITSFHYLNFFVSILTHFDESLKEFLQSCHLVMVGGYRDNEFVDDVLDYQVKFKSYVNQMRSRLNVQRKAEFNQQ